MRALARAAARSGFGLAALLGAASTRAQSEPGAATPPASSSPAPSPPPAVDADRQARAKALFDRGATLLGAGELERALASFVASRDLVPALETTINVAFCLHGLGRYDQALDAYEEILTGYASQLDDAGRSALTDRMRELRTKIATVRVVSNVDGVVVIDGRRRGTLPLDVPIRVLPGARLLRIEKDGYRPFVENIEVTAQQELLVEARLEREPPPAATPPPTRAARRASETHRSPAPAAPADHSLARATGWILGGAGVAALGVGTWFGVSAISRKNESDGLRSGGQCFDECFDEWQKGRDDASIANIGIGVGLVAVGAGAYLVLTSRDASRDKAAVHVAAAAGAGNARLGIRTEW